MGRVDDGFGKVIGWFGSLLKLPLQICLVPILFVGLIAGGIWGWVKLTGGPPAMPTAVAEAVESSCTQAAAALPEPERMYRPTLVLPLVNDHRLLITEGLREAVSDGGRYEVIDPSVTARLGAKIRQVMGSTAERVSDPAEALKRAKAAGAEVVLFGHVETLAGNKATAEVVFRLCAMEVATGESLVDLRTFTGDSQPEPVAEEPVAEETAVDLTAADSGSTWRGGILLGLAGFALVWPLLMIPTMRRVLDRESNAATALTMLLLVAVPAAIAWPVVFADGGGIFRAILYGLAVVAAGSWCVLVMSRVAEME
ncbi:MAG: hypothetical protein HQ581_10445 [Planctomycetes bacterium]|nr:hypothetical protein [Planctomycetota bacterium]